MGIRTSKETDVLLDSIKETVQSRKGESVKSDRSKRQLTAGSAQGRRINGEWRNGSEKNRKERAFEHGATERRRQVQHSLRSTLQRPSVDRLSALSETSGEAVGGSEAREMPLTASPLIEVFVCDTHATAVAPLGDFSAA